MIWTEEEKKKLINLVEKKKYKRIPWTRISKHLNTTHSASDCRKRYEAMRGTSRLSKDLDTIGRAAAHLGVAVNSLKKFNDNMSLISDEFRRNIFT